MSRTLGARACSAVLQSVKGRWTVPAALPQHAPSIRHVSSSAARFASSEDQSAASGSSGSNLPSPSSREEARQRAWYLEDEDGPTAGPSSSLPNHSASSSSGTANSQLSARQPRFTRYDPHSTTADVFGSEALVHPLPSNAPAHLTSLHHLLTTSDLIDPSSVRFLYTPAAEPAADASLTRVTRRWGSGIRQWTSDTAGGATRAGAGVRALFGDVGATWDWVVVAQVKGRGKGVVARAERMIRLWLRGNPVPELSTRKARIPRLDPETDWSIVPVGQEGADGGTCINLFTEEGMERWGLAQLWESSAALAPAQR